jgi:hypothetical protein
MMASCDPKRAPLFSPPRKGEGSVSRRVEGR